MTIQQAIALLADEIAVAQREAALDPIEECRCRIEGYLDGMRAALALIGA
ncbi:MAG: hypothetical protein ACYDAR_00185 [Thermomicrobiales bacterium]